MLHRKLPLSIDSGFPFWQTIQDLIKLAVKHICKLSGLLNIVLQSVIQYGIIKSGKAGAYYGNKKRKCNGSRAAGN